MRDRIRSWSASRSWPARWASAVRKVPARVAQVPSAITPPNTPVGFSQDAHRSPYPSAGTRPDAMPPATVPRKNGARIEDRGGGEQDAEQAGLSEGGGVLPEGEAGASQDDAEQGEQQRHEEGGHRCREGLGERCPPGDQDEDEPGVVGLPHPCSISGVSGWRPPRTLAAA